MNLPIPGKRYKHYKGGEYEIVCLAVREESLEPAVIYRSLLDGNVWDRTLASWCQPVITANGWIQQYTEIKHEQI